MEEKALNFLEKDELLHMGMIFPIKRKTAQIIYADEYGVLLKELKSNSYMLSVNDFDLGKELLDLVKHGKLFSVCQGFMVNHILEKFNLTEILECFQAVYFKKDPLPVSKDLNIKKLDLKYLDVVIEHYNTYVDSDYLKRRIDAGELYGGFLNGTLCGFAGTHEEGSLGILEIFPEYRKRGFGTILASFMINLSLKNRQIPFGQIKTDNVKSLNLQRKLGMEISKGEIYWLF